MKTNILEKLLVVFHNERGSLNPSFGTKKSYIDFSPLEPLKTYGLGFTDEKIAERGSKFALSFVDSFDKRMMQYLSKYPAAKEEDFLNEDLKLTKEAINVLNSEKKEEKNIFFIFREHRDFIEEILTEKGNQKSNPISVKLTPLKIKTTRTNALGLFLLLKDLGIVEFRTDYEMILWVEQFCEYDKGKKLKKLMVELSKLRNNAKNTEPIVDFWKDQFKVATIKTKHV